MRTLLDASFTGLDISSIKQLATLSVADRNMSVLVMLNLSNTCGDGGEYLVTVTIDGFTICPNREIYVDSGLTSIAFQSRDLIVNQGSQMIFYLLGLANDQNVSGRLILIDNSSINVQEMTDAIDGSVDGIIISINDAIKDITINVKQEQVVLGACPTPVKKVDAPQRETATSAKRRPLAEQTVALPKVIPQTPRN